MDCSVSHLTDEFHSSSIPQQTCLPSCPETPPCAQGGYLTLHTHKHRHTEKPVKGLSKARHVDASNASHLLYPYSSHTQTHALERTEGSVKNIHMKRETEVGRMLFPKIRSAINSAHDSHTEYLFENAFSSRRSCGSAAALPNA